MQSTYRRTTSKKFVDEAGAAPPDIAISMKMETKALIAEAGRLCLGGSRQNAFDNLRLDDASELLIQTAVKISQLVIVEAHQV